MLVSLLNEKRLPVEASSAPDVGAMKKAGGSMVLTPLHHRPCKRADIHICLMRKSMKRSWPQCTIAIALGDGGRQKEDIK